MRRCMCATAPGLAVLAGLLALLGCPLPDGGGGGTISGTVYDCVTGAGIYGATVVFGAYSTTTDLLGEYSLEVEESVGSVEGVFAAFKGLQYAFRVAGRFSLDPAADPMYDIGLDPADTSGYPVRSLSGRIYDGTNAEIPDGCGVRLDIFSESGGVWRHEEVEYQSASGGYSASTPTFGSDCLVFVTANAEYHNEFSDKLVCFYLVGQDLSGDRASYDLHEPASGYTEVQLSGTPGTWFEGNLVLPSGALQVRYIGGDLDGAGQGTASIYNPQGFPVLWWALAAAPNTPEPGDLTLGVAARQLGFASTISLPAPPATGGPTETVDGATAAWDGDTLSFAEAAGANGHIALLQDDEGSYGVLWLNGASLTLPAALAAALGDGAGWDLRVQPGWTSTFEPEYLLDLAVYSRTDEWGVPCHELDVITVVPGAEWTRVDLIP